MLSFLFPDIPGPLSRLGIRRAHAIARSMSLSGVYRVRITVRCRA